MLSYLFLSIWVIIFPIMSIIGNNLPQKLQRSKSCHLLERPIESTS